MTDGVELVDDELPFTPAPLAFPLPLPAALVLWVLDCERLFAADAVVVTVPDDELPLPFPLPPAFPLPLPDDPLDAPDEFAFDKVVVEPLLEALLLVVLEPVPCDPLEFGVVVTLDDEELPLPFPLPFP